MIDVVSATRLSERDFWEASALGRSLRRLAADPRLRPVIAFDNRCGLPEIYNRQIDGPGASGVLVFIHDDVWLDDYFFADRVLAGLAHFDVLGVVGNRRRVPGQCVWTAGDDQLSYDTPDYLSGRIAHGATPCGDVAGFGPSEVACEVLDGVMLASTRDRLRGAAVRFDPRFDFNFYDLDFCRVARARGLRLGTWSICLTHQSRGNFYGNPAWHDGRRRYFDKWGR